MKREDWQCKVCGSVMVRGDRYLYCLEDIEHGRPTPAWGVGDLPLAIRYDYKRFIIADEEGYWEYVPHAHADCMTHAPEPSTVVAKVARGRPSLSHRAMVFRPAKPPRTASRVPRPRRPSAAEVRRD